MATRSPSKTRNTRKNTERFRGHGEAIRWSFGALTRWWIKLLPFWLLGIFTQFAVIFFLTNELPDMTLLAILFLAFPLLIWLLAAPIIYFCIVLAGGVMSREERERRENERSLPR